MGKKIDVNEVVDKRFKNKIDEEFYVIRYLFKEKIITAMILSLLKLRMFKWLLSTKLEKELVLI